MHYLLGATNCQMTSGVIIFRGMKVGFLPGDLQIPVGETGAVGKELVLSTAYNVLPLWLRIADDQLKQAKAANDALRGNWGSSDEGNRELLVRELEPSLQVFVACGIALDALYVQLRPYAKLDKDTLDGWKKNSTSRAKQIFEVVRRVYRLDTDTGAKFMRYIEETIQFRDRAVHPSLELQQSRTRPDIQVGVDWKFSAYRYTNSHACFDATMMMLIYLHEKRSAIVELDEQMSTIFDALEELKVIQRNRRESPKDGDNAGVWVRESKCR